MNTKAYKPIQFYLVQQNRILQSTFKKNNLKFKYQTQSQFNQQLRFNHQSQFFFWKFSKDQNKQQQRNNSQNLYNDQEQLQETPKSQNMISKISSFFSENNQTDILKSKGASKSKKYIEQIKNSQLQFLLSDQFSKFKNVGKASYKYFLIVVFVLGFAYSIPKSISTYIATKVAVSSQLSIENLKKENLLLKSKLELIENQLHAQQTKLIEQNQKNNN